MTLSLLLFHFFIVLYERICVILFIHHDFNASPILYHVYICLILKILPELRITDKTFRFFADILLTPLEATRIRLVSERGFASGLVTGFVRLAREGGISQMYAGFLPILCK